jgi:hypothetical protein
MLCLLLRVEVTLRVRHIEDLCNTFSEQPRVILVAYILEVNDSLSDLIELMLLELAASKQGHLYIPSTVKFPYIFNDAKVKDLSPHSVESLYSDATVVIHNFPVLCVGIVCVPIDVISIPRCHLFRWPGSQPTNGNRIYGFSRLYVLVLQP